MTLPVDAQGFGRQLLPLDLTDDFTVGHDVADRQFGSIVSMAISPDGHVIALDALNRSVTVWDASGSEVHHWGRQGDGPGELQTPTSVSVSRDLTIAIVDRDRVSLYELDGELVETHKLPANGMFAAFDSSGRVVALTMDIFGMQFVLERPSDGASLWSRSMPESFLTPFFGPRLFGPRLVFARLSDGRAVVGADVGYRRAVIDLTNGRSVGTITREVPIRRVSDSFASRLRRYLLNPASAPAGWTSLLGTRREGLPPEMVDEMDLPETFRVIIHVFRGPPGETVWVRRGLGVGDDLAPPADPPDHAPLWDLFDGATLVYEGTVGMPEGFVPYVGDDRRLAGVQTDRLGVRAVRVMSFPAPPALPGTRGDITRR